MKWRLLCVAFFPVLLGCKKAINVDANLTGTAPRNYRNVVILGNSITYAPAEPSIGWNCNCGMAASKEEFDYVHILESRFREQNPTVIVKTKNIVGFERDAGHYDFEAELKDLKDTNPDLLIIKIGENIAKDTDLEMFDKRYTDLINYFKAGNPGVIVLSGSSVWSRKIDKLISRHSPYVLFEAINTDLSNFATGLYNDTGVGSHPSDRGMRYIASIFWAKIKTLK
jgi:hypothetical protein